MPECNAILLHGIRWICFGYWGSNFESKLRKKGPCWVFCQLNPLCKNRIFNIKKSPKSLTQHNPRERERDWCACCERERLLLCRDDVAPTAMPNWGRQLLCRWCNSVLVSFFSGSGAGSLIFPHICWLVHTSSNWYSFSCFLLGLSFWS